MSSLINQRMIDHIGKKLFSVISIIAVPVEVQNFELSEVTDRTCAIPVRIAFQTKLVLRVFLMTR